MTCYDCHSPECRVEATNAERWAVYAWNRYGSEYDLACAAHDRAEEECRKRRSVAGLVERVGALEVTLARLVTLLENNSKGEKTDG